MEVSLPPSKEAIIFTATTITEILILIMLNTAYCFYKLKYLVTAFFLGFEATLRLLQADFHKAKRSPVKRFGKKIS